MNSKRLTWSTCMTRFSALLLCVSRRECNWHYGAQSCCCASVILCSRDQLSSCEVCDRGAKQQLKPLNSTHLQASQQHTTCRPLNSTHPWTSRRQVTDLQNGQTPRSRNTCSHMGNAAAAAAFASTPATRGSSPPPSLLRGTEPHSNCGGSITRKI